ncbi:TPA: hypothetical protein N0F65_000170 [Lagenidium giganteum]|uniref:Uncharacterized protein n=1 Tax=Lagenidium giganteum TaxID=4803 RepID=A0AAV2YTP0_9STRA|nr:TPA: hypothetical protein N0F65_000170 [Lagenidium giganteum]
MALAQGDLDLAAKLFCIPVTRIINFSLLQYQLTVYHHRWREPRVLLLLLCALTGFAVLVPAAYPDDRVLDYLSTISEVSTTITLLSHLTILCRDLRNGSNLPLLRMLLVMSEVVVASGLVCCVLAVLLLIHAADSTEVLDTLASLTDYFIFWYVCFFNTSYLVIVYGGVQQVLKTQKLELGAYLLFATHEYPFILLENATGLDWEQAIQLWLRITIVLCLVLPILHRRKRITRSSEGSVILPIEAATRDSISLQKQQHGRQSSTTALGSTNRKTGWTVN